MENNDIYLAQYEAIHRIIDKNLDIRGSALSALVQICISNGGKLPKVARDKFKDCVPDSYFDYIEVVARDVLQSSR
ncbi:hypothetical protein [Pseudomonas sp. 8O]|uniref:hypothetical protein n=1 Tax=Pseudomonas sp. 8O TaxID=2653165 RepID=UPI0013579873|nr:hypothetical protein [Pseudomonas sp. 8O]